MALAVGNPSKVKKAHLKVKKLNTSDTKEAKDLQPANSETPGSKNYKGTQLQAASQGGAQGGIGNAIRIKLFGKKKSTK